MILPTAFGFLKSGGLDADVAAYIARVTADGGTIISQADVVAAVAHAKANSYWDSLSFWVSAQFGVKKDGANAVSVLYDLKGNDAVQATGSAQPAWAASQKNGRAAIGFNGSSHRLVYTAGATTYANLSTVFAHRYNAGTYPYCIGEVHNVLPAQALFYEVVNADRVDLATGFSRDATASLAGISTAEAWKLISIVTAGNVNATSVWANGVAATMGLDTGGANAIATKLSGSIGGLYPGINDYFGAINFLDFMLFNTNISDEIRSAAESFQNTKWAIY